MRLSLPVVLLVLISACDVSSPAPEKTRPQLLSGALYRGAGDDETVARGFLTERAAEFHLDAPGLSLRLETTREGLAGHYLRFAQWQTVGAEPLRVWDGDVIVLVKGDTVRAVNLELRDEAHLAPVVDARPAVEAERRAREVLALPADVKVDRVRVVHVDAQGTARVAWRLDASTDTPPHDWSLLLDAETLNELERRDGVKFVDGVGYVFDANPVASTGNTALTDNNGATNAALDAARFTVTLPRLDGSGFTRGDFADVTVRDGGRVQSATNEFYFSRDNLGFEQANVYFHLTRAQERIQALGFTNVNNRVQGATVNAQNADNSFYSPQNRRLSFGLGGVDDAEDGDIVVHEYGHSIQDNQVPGWGGLDQDAMGEGFGDYLAASFGDALATDAGRPQLADPACVGDWDGVAYSNETPPCLRRVDSSKHYPEAAENQSHADGEMWSAALWRARAVIGADAMDQVLLESHFMLGTRASFFTAAQALLTADAMLNQGANADVIRRAMIAQGLSRDLSAPGASGTFISLPVAIGPVRDATGNYRNGTDEVRTLHVPGANGLQLHFSNVTLETHSTCLSSSCDNIYLTNAAGDLFQVISGVQSNLTTVVVPGDTINVRLVSDDSQARYGYRIDRIVVVSDGLDAGLVFDGGVDTVNPPTPDAGVPDAGRPDAGRPDAGVDAGVSDAGVRDAGVLPRSLPAYGEETLTPALTRGCGCTSGDAALVLPALLVWALRRRRAVR